MRFTIHGIRFTAKGWRLSRKTGQQPKNPREGPLLYLNFLSCEESAEKNYYLKMFGHDSRSFSRHIVCRSEVPAANHHRGDSFGGQCRYEPSPNILKTYPDKTS